MKPIVIHGAYQTSNFGDLLLLELLSQHIVARTGRTPVCPWLARSEAAHMTAMRGSGFWDCWRAEIAVLGGGGYFVDENSFVSVRRLLRYWAPAFFWRLRLIPYFILAVGAGPSLSSIARRMVRSVCNGAASVVVRDEESKELLRSIGVAPKNVIVTTDLAIGLEKSMLPAEAVAVATQLIAPLVGQRLLGLHLMVPETESQVLRRWLEVVRRALGESPVACVFFFDHSDAAYDRVKAVCAEVLPSAIVLRKQSLWVTAALISQMNGVITTKLHVGIVAWALGVPPCAVASHGKTRRFYKQIGREGFCVEFEAAHAALETWIGMFAHREIDFRSNLNERRPFLKAQYQENLRLLDTFLQRNGATRQTT